MPYYTKNEGQQEDPPFPLRGKAKSLLDCKLQQNRYSYWLWGFTSCVKKDNYSLFIRNSTPALLYVATYTYIASLSCGETRPPHFSLPWPLW